MTLRVTLSIVPFGEEENIRMIKEINISNLGNSGIGECIYGVEVGKYKTFDYDFTVEHRRSDGAEALVEKVLSKLVKENT